LQAEITEKHILLEVNEMYNNYAKVRDEKGLTDYMVAKKANIPHSTIYDWKSGRYTPKIDKLQAIAAVLECDVIRLLRG
jgi:predicted transcriptional regulator